MSGEDSWGFDSEIPDGLASSTGEIPTLSAGDRLGEDFELLEELGQGGFGIVFRAREAASGREVALKVLTRRLNDRQRQRFQREGELTAALRHPGIVRIHSAGEVDGVPYLAYELLPGNSLKEALPGLDREARLQILVDAARAVGYAHAQGVVHRDLKPDNLLLDAEGRVRVADFGLAWSQHVDRLTQSGAMVGTPSHMAPEQWDTNQGQVTPATDVWALGAILYRCLTDAPVYQANTLVEMGALVLGGRPAPPRRHDPSIPAPLEAVCLKALSRYAKDRYAEAAALADDLENAWRGRSITASSPTWARATTGLRRSWRWLIPVAGVLLVAIALLLNDLRSRPPGVVELRQWMAEARAGDVGPLEAGLPRLVDVPVGARADARLLLAMHTRGAVALAHADAALELKPSAAAHRLRGRALSELERWNEAASAWRAATELGAPAGVWLDLARVELRLGRPKQAAAACRAFLEKQRPSGPQSDARVLLFRALVASEALSEAEGVLAALGPTFDRARRHLLRVELEAARGVDVEEALREGIASWPDRPELRRALVEHLVQRGEVRAAREAVSAWEREGGGAEAQAVRRALGGLFRIPVKWDGLPQAWHGAVVGWLIGEAERELALRDRAGDSMRSSLRGAPPVATREARARAALQTALQLDAGPDQVARAHRGLARLHPPGARARTDHLRRAAARLSDDPLTLRLRADDALALERPSETLELIEGQSDQAAQALRGRAYAALGRLDEAVRLLDAASTDRRRADVCRELARVLGRAGRQAEQRAVEERIRRINGSKRKEARAQYERARKLRKGRLSTRERLLGAYREAFELDPGLVEARFAIGKLEFVGGKNQLGGLVAVVAEIERGPHLFAEFQRSLLAISQGFDGRKGVQKTMALGFDLTKPRHQLAWLVLATAAIEFEGRADLIPRATKLANALLARDPSAINVWVMRGFLFLRSGRFARAARDLEIAAEAAPAIASVPFYRALLAARRRRPAAEVRSFLHRARQQDYECWDEPSWKREFYPEMKPYWEIEDMDAFGR